MTPPITHMDVRTNWTSSSPLDPSGSVLCDCYFRHFIFKLLCLVEFDHISKQYEIKRHRVNHIFLHIWTNTSQEWVNEWLLLNTSSAVFSATCISWRKQVNFQWDDDEVRFVLDLHAELDFYSASSLKQQSADRHVALLWHIILISSQPVFGLIP
jgi:hypothetical protein